MAMSEAMSRAQEKYRTQHTKSFMIRLNTDTDADIIARLEKIPNKTDYLRGLIRWDIRRNG